MTEDERKSKEYKQNMYDVRVKKNLFGRWCFVDANGNTAQVMRPNGKESTSWHGKSGEKAPEIDYDMRGLTVDGAENYYTKNQVIIALLFKGVPYVYRSKTSGSEFKQYCDYLMKNVNVVAYYFCPEELPVLKRLLYDGMKKMKGATEESADIFLSEYMNQVLKAQERLIEKDPNFAKYMEVSSEVFRTKKHSYYKNEFITGRKQNSAAISNDMDR